MLIGLMSHLRRSSTLGKLPATTIVVFLWGLSIASAAVAQTHQWSQRFGGTSTDEGWSVAVDGSGNAYLAGTFNGTVNFGGGGLTSAGGYDVFVAKYNASGIHQWSKRFGSTGFDRAEAIAVDGTGGVSVIGRYEGTIDFGGGGLTSAGLEDIFLVKFDTGGVHQWSQRFGSFNSDFGMILVTDPSGNVIAGGRFTETVNFGGGPFTSAGSSDIFIAKYSGTGTHQWSKGFGGTSVDSPGGIAVDGAGNVVVTGDFDGTANFGGGGLTSAGAGDIFVVKYDAGGVHQWSQRFGDNQFQSSRDVSVDGAGNVAATGLFRGTVNFGGGLLTAAGFNDIFLVKFNAAGTHQWSRRFGDTDGDAGEGVSIDAAGKVLLTGSFNGTVDFGGGALTSAGNADVFLAQYDAAGAHQWSRRFGDISVDQGLDVAVDGAKNILLTGSFGGTVDFGGGPLVSGGSIDIFLAKYYPAASPPILSSIVDVGNDQGRWVRVTFDRSTRDFPGSPTPVLQYEAFRRIDPLPASMAAGEVSAAGDPRPRALIDGWEFAAAIPAHGEAVYNMVVPTLADSTISQGMHRSVFFVRAATADPYTFYDSAADSGYSLDNLAPFPPQNLLYAGGTLYWEESEAADFDYFTVYGSVTGSLDGSAVQIGYTVGTNLNVTASPYAYYFVTATDFSGNEGDPAALMSQIGVDALEVVPVLAVSAYPSPFYATTTIQYTLPAEGKVTVAVYDARGARVAVLVDAENPAGAYVMSWEGRDDRGRPADSGVYFVKVAFAGEARAQKIVMLK